MKTVTSRYESTLWMSDYVNNLLGVDSVETSMSPGWPEAMMLQSDREPSVNPAGPDSDNETPSISDNNAPLVISVLRDFLEADGSSDCPTGMDDTMKTNEIPAPIISTMTSKHNMLKKSKAQQDSFISTIDHGVAQSLLSMMHQHPQNASKRQARRVKQLSHRSSSYEIMTVSSDNVKPRNKSENRQHAGRLPISSGAASTPIKFLSTGRIGTPRSNSTSMRTTSSKHASKETIKRSSVCKGGDQELNDSIGRINARLSAIDAKLERLQEDDLLKRVEDMFDSDI